MNSPETQRSLDFTGSIPPDVWAKIQDGMAQADQHADPEWRHVFDGCVLAAARKKATVTVDDVLDELEAINDRRFARRLPLIETHNTAAIGPAMLRAESYGILEHTEGFIRSRRKAKHGNVHRVWKSNYYERQGRP